MNAVQTSAVPAATAHLDTSSRSTGIGMLRMLLLAQATVALAIGIGLSILATRLGPEVEAGIRFAAGGAVLFAIFAAIASRGARRRRPWAWTLAALLQVVVAVGTGIAVLVAEWHPGYLAAFAAATAVMLVLSAGSVRRTLGQD